MNEILQRTRLLLSCILGGAATFTFLGYLAKVIPSFATGVYVIYGLVALFGIFLFACYPSLREEVGAGAVSVVLGALLLCL